MIIRCTSWNHELCADSIFRASLLGTSDLDPQVSVHEVHLPRHIAWQDHKVPWRRGGDLGGSLVCEDGLGIENQSVKIW